MEVKRRPTWRSDLFTFIQNEWHTNFNEAQFNCAVFCGLAIDVILGEGGLPWRQYMRETIEASLGALEEAGYPSLDKFIQDYAPRIPASQARLGDLLVVDPHGEKALGVCQGSGVYVVTGKGLAVISREGALFGYKVGM